MTQAFPGTDGYADEAPDLIERYESMAFEAVHAPVLHLLPTRPCRVLEIGAGTGRDAASFARLGHEVMAVEPTLPLLEIAKARHAAEQVLWLHDGLPDLLRARAGGGRFDLVMLTAVWMHLNEAERRRAMPVVAGLVAPAGRMVMMLRYGPVPPGRRMFQIPEGETPALAAAEGLDLIHDSWNPSMQPENRARGVRWNRLVFERTQVQRVSADA